MIGKKAWVIAFSNLPFVRCELGVDLVIACRECYQ